MGLYTAVAQSIPLLCWIHSEWTIPPRKINWKESLAKPTTYPSVYLDSSCPSYQQLMENYRDPWRINNFYGIYTHVGLHDVTWCSAWMLKSYQHKLNNIKKARKIRIRAINQHWTNLNQIKLYQIIWASKPSKKMVGMNINLPARVFHEFQPPVFPPGLLQARQKPQCLPGGWMAETKAHDKVTWACHKSMVMLQTGWPSMI